MTDQEKKDAIIAAVHEWKKARDAFHAATSAYDAAREKLDKLASELTT